MTKGISIQKFIREALRDIQKGTTKDFILGNINFEVIITTRKSRGGKVDIKVVSGGMDLEDQITHRITFSVASKKSSAHAVEQLEKLLKKLSKTQSKK